MPWVTWLLKKIVEPSLGKYNPHDADDPTVLDNKIEQLNALEKKKVWFGRGGKYADFFCLLLAWTVVPENGILRHPETGLIAGSPFFTWYCCIYFLYFLPSLAISMAK